MEHLLHGQAACLIIYFQPGGDFGMRLPEQDSAVGRGVKTAVQAIIGFFFGLVVVVWNVPGVPGAVIDYTKQNIGQILMMGGLSAGFTSLVWNMLRRDVKNY